MGFFGILWALIPLFFAWQLLRLLLLTRRVRQTDTHVLGRIVRLRQQATRNGTRLVPTARFTTHLGQVVEAESQGFLTTLTVAEGDQVSLHYDPDHPARFLFEKELAGPGTYLLCGVAAVGALLALVTTLSALLHRGPGRGGRP